MINLYIGYDEREGIGTHVFISSLLRRTTVPVRITIMHKPMLHRAFGGDVADGTNAFTLSRFLIPFLQDWRGTAIFLDGADMLIRADLAELEALRDPYSAVQVVKHSYKTKHQHKYIGTSMEAKNEDYFRKNWASAMLINCSHYAWRRMTPSYMRSGSKLGLLNLSWMEDSAIGELPSSWNWLVDEYGPSDEAKLLHWTCGSPWFDHYNNAPCAEEWFAEHQLLLDSKREQS